MSSNINEIRLIGRDWAGRQRQIKNLSVRQIKRLTQAGRLRNRERKKE